MTWRKIILFLVGLTVMTNCQIQPPLRLADTVPLRFALVQTQLQLETIWGVDETWREGWWYGWDDEDVRLFGVLDYPVPSTFQARFYFLGESPAADGSYVTYTAERILGTTFTRHMPVGWHDMLFWSDIDSDDGTQVLLIDESNPLNIQATTTGTRLSYGSPTRSGVFNNPEIFYAGMPETFYISKDPNDYDYYDEEQNLYVKQVNANLKPLVYTYLVQIVLYNNSNRITGVAERSAMTSLASGVNVRTGHTLNTSASVSFGMRLKYGLAARNHTPADILGGKLTTFGLCDMEPWSRSRSNIYSGSRSDLANHVIANFSFNNNADSVYRFEVTDQMRRQAHGGVITIEVDVDTLTIPQSGSHGTSSGFDPWIQPRDSIEHEFDL